MKSMAIERGYKVVDFGRFDSCGVRRYNGIVVFDENDFYVKEFHTVKWLDSLRCKRWLRKQIKQNKNKLNVRTIKACSGTTD